MSETLMLRGTKKWAALFLIYLAKRIATNLLFGRKACFEKHFTHAWECELFLSNLGNPPSYKVLYCGTLICKDFKINEVHYTKRTKQINAATLYGGGSLS